MKGHTNQYRIRDKFGLISIQLDDQVDEYKVEVTTLLDSIQAIGGIFELVELM